eukprot:404635-Alexandrium_andersonii.AAC.1
MLDAFVRIVHEQRMPRHSAETQIGFPVCTCTARLKRSRTVTSTHADAWRWDARRLSHVHLRRYTRGISRAHV